MLAIAIASLVLTLGAAAGAKSLTGQIVFSSNLSPAARMLDGRVGTSRLHAFSIDERPRVDLSAGIGRLSDGFSSLSPDGRLVAFVRSDPETFGSELWVANEDGSSAHRLLAPERGEYFSFEGVDEFRFVAPAWSPDGQRLAIDAVSTASCLPGYTKCASWYTVLVDLDGRRQGIVGGLNAAWSPDGRHLLVKQGLFSLDDANTWELAVERVDGLLDVADWGADDKRPDACWHAGSWSPDGSRLLLVEGACGGFERRLHVIRTRDWTETAQLTGCCGTWVPNGSRIAYVPQKEKTLVVTTVTRDVKRPRRLASAGYPVWSPSGDRLAYVRTRKHRLELVTARGDGTAPRRIASGPWDTAGVVAWSRDGRRIAFTTARGRTRSIAAVGSSGGPVQTVRRDVEGALDLVVGWTAGDRVVIERRVVGLYPQDIWATGPDGSGLRRLTTGTAALGATWSPDGSQIAFWRDIPATRKHPEMLYVYVMSAAGGGPPRRIVGGPHGSYASHPDWAPDGKRLVFARWPDGNHQDLFTVASNGGTFRRVTATGHASAPAWSPDGRTIVFSDDGQLTAISPNGGQLRRLGETPLTQYCSGADWSPDASRIAAVCNSQLVVLEADGSGLRVLAPDAESAPSWSPDGNWIVYQSGTRLKMVGAQGGAPSTIDLYGAEARDPDWSP